MRTWAERVHGQRDADGFTLIEVIVAMVIIGLVAAAAVPLLITTARATQLSKLNTIAKNLNQLRLDAMRNLPFHVDVQNGAYVDMLDYYYHDLSATPTTLPYTISGAGAANCTVSGQWVDAGTPAAGAPPLPYYQTTFNPVCGFPAGAEQTIPSTAGFTQTVYTQFLTSALPVPGVVPDTTLTSQGYNSQLAGKDVPPSLSVGVTVISRWSAYGTAHNYRSYTEIAASGVATPLISSRAQATALLISSHAERTVTSDPSTAAILRMSAGAVQLAGSQSNSSSVALQGEGAYAEEVGTGRIDGAQANLAAPPNPSSVPDASATSTTLGTTGCNSGGWAQLGPTAVHDLSATTASGLPVSPTDVGTGGAVQAEVDANGGGACAGLAFANQLNAAVPTDPKLALSATNAMVLLRDTTGAGAELAGRASLNASSSAGVAGSISATAATSSTTYVAIFPGLSFVPAGVSTCGSGTQSCGSGLVNVFLRAASLSCQSGTAPSVSYQGYVTYWTTTGWHSVTIDWSGAAGSDPLAGVDLSQQVSTYSGSPVRLSDYISSWSTGRSLATVSGGASGNEAQLAAAVAITTAPTRLLSDETADPGSQIGVQIGQLDCAAVDNR